MASPLPRRIFAMEENDTTAPSVGATDISSEVSVDNNHMHPHDHLFSHRNPCSQSNIASATTKGCISVDNPPRTPRNARLRTLDAVNSPQQRAIKYISVTEAEDTSGYDSDGVLGPFYDAHDNEGLQDFDEDSKPSIAPISINDEDEDNEANVAIAEDLTPQPFAIEEAIVKKLKVQEIREELRKRKQPRNGLKAVLLARLRQSMLDEAPVYPERDLVPPSK